MGNNSGYLARLQAQKQAEITAARRFTMQWCADAAILAAHDTFGRRGDILVAFFGKFKEYAREISEMTLSDSADLEYTKHKIDTALASVLPEDKFQPWDERYGG